MSNKSSEEAVLVVAAHPDDEVLGCGGTMARHAAMGHVVHTIFIADGEGARQEKAKIAARYQMAEKAAKTLGAQPPIFAGFADQRLDTHALSDIAKPIEQAVREIRPTIVYTHHRGDLNLDHQIVHEATMVACRPLPGSSIKVLWAYEVLSATHWAAPNSQSSFEPQCVVNIADYVDKKKAALEHYTNELCEFPHARSVKSVMALAHLRGAVAGLPAAEAFVALRQVHH